MAITHTALMFRRRAERQLRRQIPMRLNLLEDECLMTFKAPPSEIGPRVLDRLRGVGACPRCGSRELCYANCWDAPWNQEEGIDKNVDED